MPWWSVPAEVRPGSSATGWGRLREWAQAGFWRCIRAAARAWSLRVVRLGSVVAIEARRVTCAPPKTFRRAKVWPPPSFARDNSDDQETSGKSLVEDDEPAEQHAVHIPCTVGSRFLGLMAFCSSCTWIRDAQRQLGSDRLESRSVPDRLHTVADKLPINGP
jgi:hypothetical protein